VVTFENFLFSTLFLKGHTKKDVETKDLIDFLAFFKPKLIDAKTNKRIVPNLAVSRLNEF
jgi:hypothetical protein